MTLGYKIDDAFMSDMKAAMTKQIGIMSDHPEVQRGACAYANTVSWLATSTYDVQKERLPELMKELDQRWNDLC
jgi:hypothetical protein